MRPANVRGPYYSEALQHWRYNMRHDFQKIADGLFLGPYSSTCRAEPLVESGITHIALIHTPEQSMLLRPRFSTTFSYMALSVCSEQALIPLFEQFRVLVESARNGVGQRFGAILVCCLDGISLSPTFMAAYIMSTCHWDHQTAIDSIQEQRFCAHISSQVSLQLREYTPILDAAKSARELSSESSRPHAKRQNPDSEDSRPSV